MTDWNAAFDDRLAELGRQPAARAPATLGEIWKSEWAANGLETSFGVGKPFHDAYDELFTRTSEITGKPVPELARERGLNFFEGGVDRRIDALGKIVDSLPDNQAAMLADYKDVHGRARAKAHEITKDAEETRAATYGLSANATGFLAGVSRQMVDPLNLITAPLGATNPATGAAKGAVFKWLGKEFAIGAGTQAAQEFYISHRRDELGLPNNSFENILQAGIGQAGLSGLFRAAGAAYRALRASGKDGPAGMAGVSPEDFDAAAHASEADALTNRAIGHGTDAQDAVHQAGRALNGDGPLEGTATSKRALVSNLDGLQPIIRPDGERFLAKYIVVDRKDLIASHDLDGNVNPAFPQELQPRDRERDASRLWVNENAARLEPELLGAASTARDGAPVVGTDGIVESGNGRVLLIDTAYRSHPERAQAYRDYLDSLGFDVADKAQPVLVRVRQEDLTFAERKAFTDESNVPATASLSATERAAKDARALHESVLSLWQGGEFSAPENAAFLRGFSNSVLTAPERGAFLTDGGGLSKEGRARIEAALVSKGWQSEAVTRALTEDLDATSKGILNAFADTSATAARLQSAVAEGRIDPAINPLPALLRAHELVDRARRTGQKPALLFDQIDLERGAVSPEVRAAAELFFRNADMTLAAGRETIAARINDALTRALTHEPGGLFGDVMDSAAVLRAARISTEGLTGLDLAKAMTDAAGQSKLTKEAVRTLSELKSRQPFQTVDEMYDGIERRQQSLVSVLQSAQAGEVKNPGFKAKDGLRGIAEKIRRKGYDDAREVTDAIRAGVIIDSPDQASAVVAALRNSFGIIDEGWKTTPVGYTDRKIVVVMPEGHLAEVQIWSRETFAAKSAGHKLYEAEARAKALGDQASVNAAIAEQKAFWADVYSAANTDWAAIGASPQFARSSLNAARASGSDRAYPELRTSTADTGTQPRFVDNTNAVSSDVTIQARLSKSNQANFADIGGTSERVMPQVDPQSNSSVKGLGIDPNIRQAEQLLAEAGGDVTLHLDEGEAGKISARQSLADIVEQRKAATELGDCIDRTGGRIKDGDA